MDYVVIEFMSYLNISIYMGSTIYTISILDQLLAKISCIKKYFHTYVTIIERINNKHS